MSDRQSNSRMRRPESRLTRRRTRRWALGSLLAAVAAGTARASAQDRQSRNESLAAELERARAERESAAQHAEFVDAILDQLQAIEGKLMQ